MSKPLITISIPAWKFEKLVEKIDLIKKGLRLAKINEQLKSVIIDDLYAIEGIIKQNKKENKNGHHGHDIKTNSATVAAASCQGSGDGNNGGQYSG